MDFRTGIILSPERFPFAFAVVLNDAVRRLQDGRSRAVILLQTDHLGARKMLFKAENVLDRSAAEPVNALVVIADHHTRSDARNPADTQAGTARCSCPDTRPPEYTGTDSGNTRGLRDSREAALPYNK